MVGKRFVKAGIELDVVRKSFSLLHGGSSVSSEFFLLDSVHNESPSPYLFPYLEQLCYSLVVICLAVAAS